MTLFAQLDASNVVLKVEVISEIYSGNEEGLSADTGLTYKEYTPERLRPVIGGSYVAYIDKFTLPQPYPSWTLDPSGTWNPPSPMPTSLRKEYYKWDEETLSWTTTYTLQEYQANELMRIRAMAKFLLESTDWYVIRKLETGTDIPTNIILYRNQVRAVSNQFETDIMNASDIGAASSVTITWPE